MFHVTPVVGSLDHFRHARVLVDVSLQPDAENRLATQK